MESYALSGSRFSPQNNLILRSVYLARRYTGVPLWISTELLHKLDLHLAPHCDNAVRLDSSNRNAFFHHHSQFTESLFAIEQRYTQYTVKKLLPAGLFSMDRKLSVNALTVPLSTNGERFPGHIEAEMISKTTSSCSRYWASEDEARFIFESPFNSLFLQDTKNKVEVPLLSACTTAPYFNVSGTLNPTIFNPHTCARYDPINYSGLHYKPVTAVRLKRLAIRCDCLDCARWITPRRALSMGVAIRPQTEVFRFIVDGEMCALVNVKCTANPELVERALSRKKESILDDDDELSIVMPSVVI